MPKAVKRTFPRKVTLYRGKRQVVRKTLRDYDIFEMARDGYNAQEISDYLSKKHGPDGLSPSNVSYRLRMVMENIRTNSIHAIEDYRQMCVSQIDRQLANASKIANGGGKANMKLAAIDRIIRLQERKAKVLGLDQETRKVHIQEEIAVRIYPGLTQEDLEGQPKLEAPRIRLAAPTDVIDVTPIGEGEKVNE
jgi:DNA-binding CsgD family transcriptional regulator